MVAPAQISVSILEPDESRAKSLAETVEQAGYRISDDAEIVIIGSGISPDEFARWLKNNKKQFVIIGQPENQQIDPKLQLIVDQYITEPVSPEKVRANVEKVYARLTEMENKNELVRRLEYHSQVLENQQKHLEKQIEVANHECNIIRNRLDALYNSLSIGIIFLDSEKKVTSANSEAERLLGIQGKIIEMGRDKLGNYLPFVLNDQIFEEAIQSGQPINFTSFVLNGRVIEIEISAITKQSKSPEFIILLRNITEITREQEWLKSLLSAMVDGVIVIDRSKHIIWCNKVVKQWFGDSASERLSTCFSFWAGRSEACPDCSLDQVFLQGNTARFMERIITAKGEERFFEITVAPVKSSNGEISQAVEIARDVTNREELIRELMSARKNLEDMNRQITEQFRTLRTIMEISETLQRTERLDEVLHIILTAVTAREGLGFNRAFLLLINEEENTLEGRYALGPSSPEEAGRIWYELGTIGYRTLAEVLQGYLKVTDATDTMVNKMVKEIKVSLSSDSILTRVIRTGEAIIVSPENIKIWEEAKPIREILKSDHFAIVPLLAMTKCVGVLIVDNMITGRSITSDELDLLRSIINHASLAIERSSLTEKLRKSYEKVEMAFSLLRENQEKLVRAEKLSSLGAMAAQLAHEIKNPLVSVGGFARNILRKLPHDDPLYEKVKIISDETSRIEQFIADFLNFARFSKSTFKLSNVDDIITQTVTLLTPSFQEKKIKVRTKLGGVRPFYFDPDQMRQVFLNLLKNSLEVLQKGGQIIVRSREEERFCWVEIEDNGPGIPDEHAESVFRPFFTTRSEGTGLGLSISAQIIESHSGQIWFRNNPISGVTFFIRIPMTQPHGKINQEV